MIELKTDRKQHLQQKKCFIQLPMKFKAIILKSIFQKHRNKQQSFLKNIFFKWYVRCNTKCLSNTIDSFLIAQNKPSFAASQFFYRMKHFVRIQTQKQQQLEISQKIELKSNPKDNKKSQNSEQQMLDETLHIKKTTINVDNLSKYFQSLKHIFSMKLLEGQQIKSFDHDFNHQNRDVNKEKLPSNQLKYKKNKYKTQGCETRNQQQSLQYNQYQFFQKNDISVQYTDEEKRQQQNKLTQLGKKVSLNLIKLFILNRVNIATIEGFSKIKHFSQYLQREQQVKTKIQSFIHQIQCNLTPEPQNYQYANIKQNTQSQKFIQLKSQKSLLINSIVSEQSQMASQPSTLLSIPDSQVIKNQISHVQYSISLLSSTIKKDQQIKWLYKQFSNQYNEFQSIEKDFQTFRIKTKNSLFERLRLMKENLEKYYKIQGFNKIKKYALIKTKYSNTGTNFNKIKDQCSEYLSRSRVNIKTLHDLCGKSIVSPSKNIVPSIENKSQIQQKDKQNLLITSIRIINTNCVRSQYQTSHKQIKPVKRGGIKKQTLPPSPTITERCMNNKNNQLQQNLMIKTVGQKMFKKFNQNNHSRQVSNPSNIKDKHELQFIQTAKSYVKFKVPTSSCQNSTEQRQNIKISSKQSSQISIKQQQYFKQKNKSDEKENNDKIMPSASSANKNSCNIVYDLSIKSFQSQQSSTTKKYHAQIKSQYWWADCAKQNQQLNEVLDADQFNDSEREHFV